jgi:hypothetical protein
MSTVLAGETHISKPFAGLKANGGTVTHVNNAGKNVLTLSDDFKTPEAPDVHWMVVDSKGNSYLLSKLKVKEDKYHKSITLPVYIPDISKVVMWCAFAETNLGEAAFDQPVK